MNAHYKLLAGALLALGLAAPAAAFDLAAAVQAARSHDAGFAGARASLRAGQEKAVQGRSQLLPSVGLSADLTRTDAMKPDADPYNSRSLGIKLTQPLFDVGNYVAYRKGQIASELAELQYQASSQQLVADVARAYFDVLLAEDVLAVNQATKRAYDRQLAQARKAFEVGTATITDTHEAQAGYDAAQAREIAAMSDLEVKRNQLATLTGLVPEQIGRLKRDPELTLGAVDDWLQRARSNSLALKSAEQQQQLAERSLQEARGKHLPSVSLSAAYSDNYSNSISSKLSGQQHTRGNSLGLNLSMPLYAGGAINSQVSEAAANLDKAGDDVEAARRKLGLDVRRAWLGVSNGTALLKAQQQLLVSAKSKLDSTRLGKDVGVRTNLDLLNAERDYQDAVRGVAEARYNLLYARLLLSQAAGELDDAALNEVNRFF